MGFKSLLTAATLIAGTTAQSFAKYTSGSYGLSVNIPEGTASSGSGSIFFQISAPKGTQWLAFGQGTAMSNAQIFIIYASGSSVVLSPRTTTGHNMPEYDSSIQATVLDGSGVASDGSMVVNVRCDSCLSWSGGTMSPTSSSSRWIMAYKTGSALGSTDQDATIQQHDTHNSFTLDLTKGVSGSSSNPFVASAQSSSAGASGTQASHTAASATGASRTTAVASASGTHSVSNPVASDSSTSSSSASNSPDNTISLRSAHGIIMSVLFLGAFPLFALTLYLPTAKKVRFIHAPLQTLSVILLIVGMALGIVVGQRIDQLNTYHQVIGFIVVFVLVLVQPIMGVLQHLHFHKTGGRSMWGPVHQNLGRAIIVLGIVNGGLGWQMAGNTGAYVPYAVVSVVIFVVYAGVVGWSLFRTKSRHSIPIDKEDKSPNAYEMQNTHRRLGSDNVQQTNVQPKHDQPERL